MLILIERRYRCDRLSVVVDFDVLEHVVDRRRGCATRCCMRLCLRI